MFLPNKAYRHRNPDITYDILVLSSRKLDGFYELNLKYLDKDTKAVVKWPSSAEEEQVAMFESAATLWSQIEY